MTRPKPHAVLALALALASWCATPLWADAPRTGSVQEIIGGGAAAAPSWMVALISKTGAADIPVRRLQFCGGVLVSSEWILTAAHCVLRSSPADTEVIVGQTDIDSPYAERRQLAQIVVHPGYNSRTFENDVALLQLALPTQLSPVAILDLSSSLDLAGERVTAFGWGQAYVSPARCELSFAAAETNGDDYECRIHDFARASRQFQASLLQAGITILSEDDCNARIRDLLAYLDIDREDLDESADFTPENQVCAFDPQQQKGVCFGDSGGPVTVERDGRQMLVGTASLIYGLGGCAREFATDVFTLSAAFDDFMEDVMHRDYELSFERLCPAQVVPTVEYEATANAATRTRVRWPVSATVSSYIVRYAGSLSADEEISTLVVDGSLSELSAELEAGTSLYVSVQARNEYCSSPVSDVLEVRVPEL